MSRRRQFVLFVSGNSCCNLQHLNFLEDVKYEYFQHAYARFIFQNVPNMDDLQLISLYCKHSRFIEWSVTYNPSYILSNETYIYKTRYFSLVVMGKKIQKICKFWMTFQFQGNLESDFRTFYSFLGAFL